MSAVNDIEFGTRSSFSIAAGLFTHEAKSPDPPASQNFTFTNDGKKKKAVVATTDNEPQQEFEEVNIENYRLAFRNNPVFFWGVDNRFPQWVDEEAEKCDTLEAALKWKSDQLYGQGFFFYEEVFESGQLEIKEVDEPQMRQYFYDIGYYEYYAKACKELPRWGNVFPLYLMNKDRKIVQIKLYDTPWCRLERPHFKTGKTEAIYVSAQWANGIVLSSKQSAKDPYIKRWVKRYELLDENTYLDQMEVMTNTFTFARHLKYHTSGKAYGRAPWHAAYKNRWTALSAAVPEMKMRLFEYAMTINYVVYIDESYWLGKYPDIWNGTDDNKKKAIVIQKQQEIEKHLTGKDNAWKTLFASKLQDANGKDIKSIIFDVIDNTLKEGTYVPDSQIADTHIYQAVGVDPSSIGMGGNTAGGKQSAGSGSNIREALLSANGTSRPDRELINTPYYDIRDLMFPTKKNIKIGVRDYTISTLDNRSPNSGSEVTTK